MNIFICDTETTGFVKPHLDEEHPAQPHIVQLAGMLCNGQGCVLGSLNYLIDNQVDIPAEAAAVHGITREMCADAGWAPKTALKSFMFLAARAGLVVAHNKKFDLAVIKIALIRAVPGAEVDLLRMPSFCTMEAAAPIVNLPPTPRMLAAGFNKPKAPKLSECITHFFGEALEGAHDAMVDVNACKRIFFRLASMGRVPGLAPMSAAA